MKSILSILILAACSCTQLKYSATTKAGTETFAYNSFGGSGVLDSAGGTRLTHNHNKTAGQFFQAATAIAAGGFSASVKRSDNSLSATQSTNAAGVTNTAAREATKQAAIKAQPTIVSPPATAVFPPQ